MLYLGTIANVGSDVLDNTNTAAPFTIPAGTARLFVQPDAATMLAAVGTAGGFAPAAAAMLPLTLAKPAVLFDGTSTANTAFDTGTLDVSDYDCLAIEVLPSGAAAASTLSLYDVGLSASTAARAIATGATAAVKTAAWGPGEVAAATGEYVGGQGGALPASVKIGIGALGVGITARIRVVGRRTFDHNMGQALPVSYALTTGKALPIVLAIRKTDAGAGTCKVFAVG